MIVLQTKPGQVRFVGISARVLAVMTGDQLVAELKRVDRELALVRSMLKEHPIHRREKNCLRSERLRILQAMEQKGAQP